MTYEFTMSIPALGDPYETVIEAVDTVQKRHEQRYGRLPAKVQITQKSDGKQPVFHVEVEHE